MYQWGDSLGPDFREFALKMQVLHDLLKLYDDHTDPDEQTSATITNSDEVLELAERLPYTIRIFENGYLSKGKLNRELVEMAILLKNLLEYYNKEGGDDG